MNSKNQNLKFKSMKKQFIVLLSLCGLFFASCEKDDPTSGGNNQEEVKNIKQFVSVVAGQTAMPDYGQLPNTSVKFNAGDEISIYFWKNSKEDISDASKKTYLLKENGNEWTPKTENDSMFWEKSDEKLYFAAMYPSREVFDLKADNITANDENILVANIVNGVKAQDDAIRFSFTHLFSKVVINIIYGSEHNEADYTNRCVTLKNISKSGIYNHIDMILTPSETKEDNILNLVSDETSAFEGYILPQELSIIEFSASSASKNFSCSFDPTSLSEIPGNIAQNFIVQSNKIYTYTFKAGKDKLILESVTVKDWIKGEVINGNAGEKKVTYAGGGEDPVEN